ncbi:MAG: fibrobacter succinogenes major paralogous domain-containing protein [Prevotellaceae bacterium]|nr:fibrobacter succinogenes major paralogous domain-containing protein [Prevotellaceae bacterium]
MRRKRIFAAMAGIMVCAAACSGTKDNEEAPTGAAETGTVTDIDGNTYTTVKIGARWWMAENLRTYRFRNGDEITRYPHEQFAPASDNPVSSTANRAGSTGGSKYDGVVHFAFPNNDSANVATYGLGYTWFAAVDERGLCPEGWTLPDTGMWYELCLASGIGGRDRENPETWTDVAPALKTDSLWIRDSTSTSTVATNKLGFSIVPAGDLSAWGFAGFGAFARFWTPSYVHHDSTGWGRRYMEFSYRHDDMWRGQYRSNSCISIRCVKL